MLITAVMFIELVDISRTTISGKLEHTVEPPHTATLGTAEKSPGLKNGVLGVTYKVYKNIFGT